MALLIYRLHIFDRVVQIARYTSRERIRELATIPNRVQKNRSEIAGCHRSVTG